MKKRRLSLSALIMIGLGLGIVCGLVFGEHCARLKIFGDAFIKLLQMTILPYITVSLMVGIGRLTFAEAKTLAIKGGILLLVFWGIAFAIVLAMPLAFPSWETASFFSTSVIEMPKKVNFLDLYIPSNPFGALAQSVVPAVVLFTISVGVALIGVKNKEKFIAGLSVFSDALTRVAQFTVKLAPIGVFGIAASAAGTMTLEEFGRIQVYLMTYIAGALLLTFWVLPMLLTALTPFRYRDVLGLSKDALLTAFTTGNLFVILPVLIEDSKKLFREYRLRTEETDSLVDIVVPVSFNFPSAGKLLTLLFILFGAWFSGRVLTLAEYPGFIVTGLFSSFGSLDIAIPFLLDTIHLPSDLFQLYLVTGVINGRFATMLAAMNLLVFTLLTTSLLTGTAKLSARKVLQYVALSVFITAGVVFGCRLFLSLTVKNEYTKDKVIAGMQLLEHPLSPTVHETQPEPANDDPSLSLMENIRKRRVIHVGYFPNTLPFAYRNTEGELVGYDVEMAHHLADDLELELAFIPIKRSEVADRLADRTIDIVMCGYAITPERLQEVSFTDPYMNVTVALVVPDHQRDEFTSSEQIALKKDLKIAVPPDAYFERFIESRLPNAEVVQLQTPREFFEGDNDIDALMISAEIGSAWTLLYPKFGVIVPRPAISTHPLAYALPMNAFEMTEIMNHWIDLKRQAGTMDATYDHWILGRDAEQKEPRWSVIRNVLHWVD